MATMTTTKRVTVESAAYTWMPLVLRRALLAVAIAGTVRFSLGKAERRAWRKKRYIPPSVWAERYRIVHMSSRPGPWRNSTTPYTVGFMDASFYPSVRRVVLCKVPQSGGSEAILNCLGYLIDREPGPVIMVYPDENMARENAAERIIPMLQSSPVFAEYLTPHSDDLASLKIKLNHMHINMAWSGSPSRLGNKPARGIVCEEIDKWKDVRAEASSLSLARQRTTTYELDKLSREWNVCTPTTEQGAIWRELESCDAIYDYYVRCPHCNHSQLMTFEGIDFGGERDPGVVKRKNLARYTCANSDCGSMWSDAERDVAVRRGEWHDRDTGLPLMEHLEQENPEKIGFHLPGWLSPFVSLSAIAADFLQWKKSGDINDLKTFKTQRCAVPWVEPKAGRKVDQILALCDDRPRGRVPGPLPDGTPRVAALVCGVDTQGTYLRYVIRAVGYGENPERWMVACGHVADFDKLEKLLFHTEWQDVDGTPYTIALTVQDAMGHRTYEVYEMCARFRGLIVPYQGLPRGSAPVRYSPREYFPGTTKKIPGGVNLLRVDTNYFKSHLAAMLAVAPQDPGAYRLHTRTDAESGAPLLDEYAQEMTVETYDDEKLKWVCPKGAANHYWDCEVMCGVAEYELQISQWPLPGEQHTTQPKKNREQRAARRGRAPRQRRPR